MTGKRMRRTGISVVLAFGLCCSAALRGSGQETDSPLPPVGQADIAVLLDQEKPDPAVTAKLAADANAAIALDLKGPERAEAMFRRAQARTLIGHLDDAIADAEEAAKLSRGENYRLVTSRYQQFLHRRLLQLGDTKRAVPVMMTQVRAFERGARGRLFTLYSELARTYGDQGDLDRAEQLDRSLHALLAESQSWSADYDPFREIFQSVVAGTDAYLREVRSQFGEAEVIFHRASQTMDAALGRYEDAAKLEGKDYPYREDYERAIDFYHMSEGLMKVQQGRALDGEVDIREVLLRRLQRVGKYHEETAQAVASLGAAFMGQGRYQDAEQMTRIALDIYRNIGFGDALPRVVGNLQQLAQILDARNRTDEAQAIYDQIDRLVAGWPPIQREMVVNETPRLKQLIGTGKAAEAAVLARRKLERERARSGDNSPATAVVRGYLASALAKSGQDGEAAAAFRAAIPVLLESSRQDDSDDAVTAGAIAGRNRYILENYIALVARNPSVAGGDATDATFGLADKLRSHSVQQALAQASARSASKDPVIGSLARTEQDLNKQLRDAMTDLANLLAQPSDRRDDKLLKELQARVAKLRTSHTAAERELTRKFPAYANLIDPPPVSPSQIRAVLHSDEALLSFYFGEDASFVWAIAKDGPAYFKALPITRAELEEIVAKLRSALEPQAVTVSEIPPFDLALAHSLYVALMQPVEKVWRPARNVIVATNGALGFLPLGVLPVTPTAQPAPDASALFAEYRSVPWLARDHTVTMVPSVSALRALRTTALSDNQREKLIGFGDPFFNEAQAAEAAKPAVAVATPPDDQPEPGGTELGGTPPAAMVAHGVPLDRRSMPLPGDLTDTLANLPRLPDTADELRAIAAALGVDSGKTLRLGKDANERVVKTTKLSDYRIVAFATHGLMADDIDGLNQPALAMTAPKVAGISGNGLLTMADILGLKLNADWVLLSACNTGAGSGAGAEAVSGLGRAFFYAGTRALVVTNWSVHSQSARELITDVFRRQAADTKLKRSEALQQAMIHLMDGPGFVDESGKTLFTYAHPLFWAPFSIIGDGSDR
jgi:CHAT domain-containing protein/tetratricopeptide (TPR) repeat protein